MATPRRKPEARIPPQNLEAEQSVLGAVLIDKDAIINIAEFLRPEHFYKENHGVIYSAMLSLYEKREPIDLVTLSSELKKLGNFDDVGGAVYLAELANFVPTAANVAYYGQIVKDHYTKRELIRIGGKITDAAFDTVGDVSELIDLAEKSVFGVSQIYHKDFFTPLKDALAETFDRLDEISQVGPGLRGVPSGLTDLDNILAGFQPSNLIIMASRPGQGKSALALNFATYMAVREKIPVGLFSLEMSREEVVDRTLVAQSHVDAWRLKTGRLEEEDFAKLQDAMGVLAEAPIFIDDTPAASIMEIRTKARRLEVEQGLKFLIVDYLQLVHGRQLENRVQEVSEISQFLKNLARELKIPVLAISQLSRAVEQRGSRRPQLADLRESGALEQDADVVMFLYREDADDVENVILDIQKHRNGRLGQVRLTFRPEYVSFFGTAKV